MLYQTLSHTLKLAPHESPSRRTLNNYAIFYAKPSRKTLNNFGKPSTTLIIPNMRRAEQNHIIILKPIIIYPSINSNLFFFHNIILCNYLHHYNCKITQTISLLSASFLSCLLEIFTPFSFNLYSKFTPF